jgi:hypothetical protein
MKYFTPELLARCRSSDGDVAEEAADQWEQAIATYNARLQKIRSDLPLGVRQLLRQASLHDAQCVTIKTAKSAAGKELFLTFRLANGSKKLAGGVELRYNLTGPQSLIFDKVLKPSEGALASYVLYDEFDLEQKRGVRVFTHSVLLTNGLEFRIRFSNLRLRWFGRVLLASSKPSEIEKEWADDDQLAAT